jgi:hypothetical protein
MKSEAEREAHDSFLRWQEVRITHFGHTANVVLTLTTAALGFLVNLVVEKRIALPTPSASLSVIASVGAFLLAIGAGLYANWSRLQDFRYTAKAARGRELYERDLAGETLNEKDRHRASNRDAYREVADCHGKCSWILLRIQLWTFVIGGVLLTVGVMKGYLCDALR